MIRNVEQALGGGDGLKASQFKFLEGLVEPDMKEVIPLPILRGVHSISAVLNVS